MTTTEPNKSSPSMAMSKAKTAANAIAVTIAIIVGITGINVIFGRIFFRADLTEDKLYKLSETSQKLVASLPDKLLVRAYISSDLQPPLNQYGRYVRDLLEEYAAASKGKLSWEAIDPLEGSVDEKNQKKEEMQKNKISPITLERVSEAKLEIGSDNYLGIAFIYGDREIQSIPTVTSTEGLEYQISSIIKRLVSTQKSKLGLVTSEGELTTAQGMQLIARVVQDYDIEQVTLDKPVPDTISALVVAGPRRPFDDKAKYFLDQYLMKGKSVAFFVDGMTFDQAGSLNLPGQDQPKIGRSNEVNLNDLLEKYGVRVQSDLVLDEQNTLGPVPVGGQLFLANHPVFVGVTDKVFAPDWPGTSRLKVLVLPFVSSVELAGALKDKKPSDIKVTPIAKSSDQSWRQTGIFIFNPQAPIQPSADKGPFTLGYAIEGKLKSAFPDGPPGTATSSAEGAGALKEATGNARLLVIGTSSMLSDQYLQVASQVGIYRANAFFFVNVADWLVHDESLIALRAKGVTARPLTVTMDGTTRLWLGFNVVGIPLLLVAFGVLRWRARTARRRSFRF